VEGKYLPASKYERVVEVETEMRGNEFNIVFPPHVALPVGATNVRVKTSQDSVKLSAPAFMAGDIPIYRPFPAFYPDDVTHSAGDTPKYDTTAYKMSYNLLSAKDESISYTFVSGVDVPLGSYCVVLRMKSDATIASDARIVVLSGDNVVVDSLHTLVGDNVWNIVKSASFNITQRGITYTIKVSKVEADVANLAVNYGFLLPEKRARVAFDVAAEYDVGECKVFDTITTDSEESTWIQVFNPEHDFAGDIVVQNSMFRWVIKQTAWKDATKVYNISGSAPVEIGKLYNKAFGDDSVAIKFKEIKPNYLKFTFELDTGNATSESTSAKEIDTVEITPFNVVIDKDVIGAYKDHYTFESTPDVMIEYENGVIAGIDSNSIYGLIKSVNVTSSYDGDIIETTGNESSDSYVVPFVIPCEITSYLYKQAADLVISKDNGDVERKFFKDDFSVDSSDNYTGHDETSKGFYTWDTANSKLVWQVTSISSNQANIYNPITAGQYGISSVSFKCTDYDETYVQTIGLIVAKRGDVYVGAVIRRDTDGRNRFVIFMGSWEVRGDTGLTIGVDVFDGATYTITVETTPTGINGKVYREGVYVRGYTVPYAEFRMYTPPTPDEFVIGFGSQIGAAKNITCEVYDLSFKPTISYADDFSTDTTERYQAVTGTVTYDDTNKRMNVTTATGANGKASGRLKSYKFCEGAQQFDVTLPVGADGDFICLVTHATDPAMTNGIGVGLQSDGAGNWNLATLSGTTVTEGAPSGLTDGKTARIEIEKDNTGAYWYYIYDAAGPKPTTATGKLFTTLSEGYTGWYANGNSKTYAIENISIRAESIVGRTNVEVTEPFWFRDEFGEDSIGRISRAGYNGVGSAYSVTSGKLVQSNVGIRSIIGVISPKLTGETTFKLSAAGTDTDTDNETIIGISVSDSKSNYTDDNVIIVGVAAAGDTTKYNKIYARCGDLTSSTEIAYTYTAGVQTELKIVYAPSTGTFTIYDSSDVLIGTLQHANYIKTGSYYAGVGACANMTATLCAEWDYVEISGTRVYNKPIHRGAMLETYHDGTQEVVGTTFIDDFNWDRSAEVIVGKGTYTWDTINGKITCATCSGDYSGLRFGNLQFGDQFAEIIVTPTVDKTAFYVFNWDGSYDSTTIPNLIDNCYYITLVGSSGAPSFEIKKRVAGVTYTLSANPVAYTATNPHVIKLLKVGSTITASLYTLDGVLIKTVTVTDSTFSVGYVGLGTWSTGSSFHSVRVIGLESTSTNGIVACIPPIGGGARYGVEESVYNTFTTENVNKGVYLTTARVKTTNPNADEVSLEYTNDTTSITLNTTPIDVDATYTVKTAPITIDANETDTLRVSVKNSTACVQSTNYVESLSLIPVSGDDVLYPQDLAFISGVKPSQKRKVEVK